MQTNLLWTGREYHSLENCLVNTTEQGAEINSVIVGNYQHKIYRVDYRIRTNQHWEIEFFEVKNQHSDEVSRLHGESDAEGGWIINGEPAPEFDGCIDIDLALTPFTNTLPINRLKLSDQESQQIQVIYLDLLEQQIKPARQKYTRLSGTHYRYENVPNDFEAVITVDELGLVVDYPQLFVRTAKLKSGYH